MANPRIPYLFSDEGPHLTPPPAGAILVHLVVNVEHWQFDVGMPRTILTPPHGKETIPDESLDGSDFGSCRGEMQDGDWKIAIFKDQLRSCCTFR